MGTISDTKLTTNFNSKTLDTYHPYGEGESD